MKSHRFTFGALSCGLGAGPKGFVQAKAQLGADSARFERFEAEVGSS